MLLVVLARRLQPRLGMPDPSGNRRIAEWTDRPTPTGWLDAKHRATGRLELPGDGAGAATDVQDLEPGAGGDDPLRQRVGVAGPGPVIAFGVDAERLRRLPGVMFGAPARQHRRRLRAARFGPRTVAFTWPGE